MANDKERVGIIGVGRMGLAMAGHLINHGYALTVCDINAESAEKARKLGAAVARTPAELGRACTFVILGVGYDEEVNEVVLGPDGVLQSLPADAIIAVSSTVAPDFVRALDDKARHKGVDVLDAPICRGRWFAAPENCWRCSAESRRWWSVDARSLQPFPPTLRTWVRSAMARSARP